VSKPTGSSREKTPVRLPAEVREQIDALRPRYPTAEALLLPALHLAQRHFGGWLSDEVIAAVADELELAPAKVYGVVTFYDLFHQRPVGRHRVSVCTNLPCALRGAEEILAGLRRDLEVGENQVTADGKLSLTHFECLGACDMAPMMMVDDDYHGRLTPEKVRRLVEDLD
jgi:NADH-quinone oxidoreductase subunit E